jgi:hypothetical protein
LAEELFRQAQCSVKVIVACFVKGCLRQTPSKMKVLVLNARGKFMSMRLLKTTNGWRIAKEHFMVLFF